MSFIKKINSLEVIDFFKDLIIIILIVVLIRSFIAMPFQISWQSMYSSYYDREFIIVDRLSYLIWEPNRWDAIVFEPNIWEDKKYFLKRIIWMPGDKLKIDWWEVYIKQDWEDKYSIIEEWYLNTENKWYTFVWSSRWSVEYNLWEDQYFVMWDNRNHSTDSRECFSNCVWRNEYISKDDIVWKVFLDLWYFNFKKFSFIQPNLWIETFPRFFSSPVEYDYANL